MKGKLSFLLFIGILLVVSTLFIYFKILRPKEEHTNSVQDQTEETYHVKIEESQNCSQEAELYFIGKEQRVYTYCIDSIQIKDGDHYVELKDLSERDSTLYHLKEAIKVVDVYKDGGSTMYEDTKDTKQSVTPFRILQCNKIGDLENERNRDIYIGSRSMKYENGFCEK